MPIGIDWGGTKIEGVAMERDGPTCTGYSPKSGPDDFLPAFERFLRAGGMFYRDGSGAIGLCYVAAGRLIAFFEPLIKSWDCLGARSRHPGGRPRDRRFPRQ